jgi:ferrous iron transport protein A
MTLMEAFALTQSDVEPPARIPSWTPENRSIPQVNCAPTDPSGGSVELEQTPEMRIASINSLDLRESILPTMNAHTLTRPAVPPSVAAIDPARRLVEAERGRCYTVRQVTPDPLVPERARQLEEIGFYPGEQVTVMTRGFPGGDPLVVRVGQSTFALRGAEAACVQIEPGGAAAA